MEITIRPGALLREPSDLAVLATFAVPASACACSPGACGPPHGKAQMPCCAVRGGQDNEIYAVRGETILVW